MNGDDKSMTIRKAYTAWAATYDSDRNPTRDLDRLVTSVTLAQKQYAAVLEIGCGTGKNSPLLARIAARLYALDFSEGMISQAKARLDSDPYHAQNDNVLFGTANLTQAWPCAAQAVNLVVSNLVLEHIADLSFVFSEAHRVLTKPGYFFICELHPFKQYQGKKATFQQAANEQQSEQQTEIPAFVHHLSDFLAAAEQAGFTLGSLREWWDDADHIDHTLPPRLVSFMFEK